MTSSQYLTLWTSLPSYDHERLHTHARYFSFVLGKTNKWKKIKRTQHLWHFNRWWYVWENEFETVASCCGFFLLRWVTLIHKTLCVSSSPQNQWRSEHYGFLCCKGTKGWRQVCWVISIFLFYLWTHTHAHSSKTLQTNAEITCQMDVSHCLNW